MPRDWCINCAWAVPDMDTGILTCTKREAEAYGCVVEADHSCNEFDPETLTGEFEEEAGP